MAIRLALAIVFAWSLACAPATAHGRASPSLLELVRLTPAAAQSSCGLMNGDQYWLCKAYEEKNCNLTTGDDYWQCKAILERQCGLAKSQDYWFCVGVTQDSCGVVPESARYWLCEGIAKRNCGVVGQADYWLCSVLQEALKPEQCADGTDAGSGCPRALRPLVI